MWTWCVRSPGGPTVYPVYLLWPFCLHHNVHSRSKGTQQVFGYLTCQVYTGGKFSNPKWHSWILALMDTPGELGINYYSLIRGIVDNLPWALLIWPSNSFKQCQEPRLLPLVHPLSDTLIHAQNGEVLVPYYWQLYPHEENTKMLCFYMAQGFRCKYQATYGVMQTMDTIYFMCHLRS